MTGTILAWTAPTQLANGDPLPSGFIAGYRIYWGTSSGSLVAVMDLTGSPPPTEIAFASITGIPTPYTSPAGGAAVFNWFALTAFNGAGFESVQTAPAQWTSTSTAFLLSILVRN